MAEDRGTIHSIAWLEIFPGLHLFSALRMALGFRMLVLAAIALVGTAAGWRIIGGLFLPDRPAGIAIDAADPLAAAASPSASGAEPATTIDPLFARHIELNRRWPWEKDVPASSLTQLTSLEAWRRQSPLIWAWSAITAPFEQVFAGELPFVQVVYWFACALWSLLLWSFFGGAITRITAVSLARQENQSWGQVTSFVRQRFAGYFVAPLFPLLGAFLIAGFLFVLGLMMRLELGVLLAGLVWPLALLAGFMMAFLLIGLFFGWPLMWGAISAEGTDAFGALSHSYSYTYQRPLHYLLYVIVAGALGVVGWYLVDLFAFWTVHLASWGVSWGSGFDPLAEVAAPQAVGHLGSWGRSLIQFWTYCIHTLALAFFFSYFWTATTVIYFLLRRLVDATEIDEVYMPEEQELHGMPPLKTGPDGVPQVVDEVVPASE